MSCMLKTEPIGSVQLPSSLHERRIVTCGDAVGRSVLQIRAADDIAAPISRIVGINLVEDYQQAGCLSVSP